MLISSGQWYKEAGPCHLQHSLPPERLGLVPWTSTSWKRMGFLFLSLPTAPNLKEARMVHWESEKQLYLETTSKSFSAWISYYFAGLFIISVYERNNSLQTSRLHVVKSHPYLMVQNPSYKLSSCPHYLTKQDPYADSFTGFPKRRRNLEISIFWFSYPLEFIS